MTILLGNTNFPLPPTAVRQKRGWLPLLTVLFLISYGLMTMLIVEQGTTIENQRALIRDLFRDSAELTALKGKAVSENNVRRGKQQSNSPKGSVTQDPVAQPPSSKAPSSQAVPQHRAQTNGSAQKPQVKTPSRPASDLTDDRRSLISI